MRTFRELMYLLASIEGVPFIELASEYSLKWSDDPKRRRALAGHLVEQVVDVEKNSRPEPDLTAFGVELKTIPVSIEQSRLVVLEDTSVTASQVFAAIQSQAWRNSHLYEKLRTILFVPIVKQDVSAPDLWYVRTPFIWMPSLRAEQQLSEDYESIREAVLTLLRNAGPGRDRLIDLGGSGSGRYLRLGTKGAGGNQRTAFELIGVGEFEEKPRAWYLRKAFTAKLIDENVTYRRPFGLSTLTRPDD